MSGVKIRRLIENKLLKRKQFMVCIDHEGRGAPNREEIRQKVSSVKSIGADMNNVVIFGVKTHFGGGRTTAFGCAYESLDAMKKVEPLHRLVKMGKVDKSTKKTRRSRKNARKKKVKVWGTGVRSERHKVRRQERKDAAA